MFKPNHFRTGNVKIGIDLHNLSLKTDSNVRTGIQQVVFNLLEAQYLMRNKTKNIPIELTKLPKILVHGDFRIDNMIIDRKKKNRILALLDWELSGLAPPFIDLSYWCLMLRFKRHWPIKGIKNSDENQKYNHI